MNTSLHETEVRNARWIWLSEDNDDLDDLPSEALLAEHGPGTGFWLTWDDHLAVHQSGDIGPESLLNAGLLPDDVWNYEDGEFGLLLRVEPVGEVGDVDSGESTTVEYRVVAVHSPRDIYGPKGSPLRDALETLEGHAGLRVIAKMPPLTTHDELDQIRAFEKAAKDAVIAAGEDKWGFEDSVCTLLPGSCQHGEGYVALVARRLIDTTPEWTQDAYDYLSRRFVAATGRRLHPDDNPAAR